MTHIRRSEVLKPSRKIPKSAGRTSLVIALITILNLSCLEYDPQLVPIEGNTVTWNVYWCYTAANNLVGGNPGSRESRWKSVLGDSTNYNVVIGLYDPAYAPSDENLNWTTDLDLTQTSTDFLNQFYINAFISQVAADSETFLFGVYTPMNTEDGVYGASIAKGSMPIVQNVALSLVFKSRIDSVTALTQEQRWRAIQFVTIHELGHSRGLTVTGFYDDHWYHGGSNQFICIMRPQNFPVPSSHIFCSWHKRILRNCLTSIQNTYDPTSSCTQP